MNGSDYGSQRRNDPSELHQYSVIRCSLHLSIAAEMRDSYWPIAVARGLALSAESGHKPTAATDQKPKNLKPCL